MGLHYYLWALGDYWVLGASLLLLHATWYVFRYIPLIHH